MGLKHRLTGKEITVKGVLADRTRPDGRRALSLTNDERRAFQRQQLVEAAVALFLDIETGHSWEEMARELDISVTALKDLTKTEDFMAAYDAHFVELGHDPRLKVTQQAIADMLPKAITELRRMLINPSTPETVRLNVIKEVFRLGGLQEPTPAKSDKQELADFLKDVGIEIDNVNVTVEPPLRPEITDANVTIIPMPEIIEE